MNITGKRIPYGIGDCQSATPAPCHEAIVVSFRDVPSEATFGCFYSLTNKAGLFICGLNRFKISAMATLQLAKWRQY